MQPFRKEVEQQRLRWSLASLKIPLQLKLRKRKREREWEVVFTQAGEFLDHHFWKPRSERTILAIVIMLMCSREHHSFIIVNFHNNQKLEMFTLINHQSFLQAEDFTEWKVSCVSACSRRGTQSWCLQWRQQKNHMHYILVTTAVVERPDIQDS